MRAPEFVAIGHVTLDHFGGVVRPGGAALYAAITAHRLGLSAAILTSHGADFPLDDIPSPIEVVTLEAGETTTFEHGAGSGGERTLRPEVPRLVCGAPCGQGTSVSRLQGARPFLRAF